jgi:hypothetical protein
MSLIKILFKRGLVLELFGTTDNIEEEEDFWNCIL